MLCGSIARGFMFTDQGLEHMVFKTLLIEVEKHNLCHPIGHLKNGLIVLLGCVLAPVTSFAELFRLLSK